MSTPDIKNAGIRTQGTIQGLDYDKDGTIDAIKVDVAKDGVSQTGIYNVHTEEGRQAFQKTLLDLGLSLPEFMSGANSAFIKSLPSDAYNTLQGLANSASALTASGTNPAPAATSNLQGRFADFVAQSKINGAMDVNALVQFVLREAYMENTKDLHFYAQKVRFYNELKKLVRDELTSARKQLSSASTAAAAWVQADTADPKTRDADNYNLASGGFGYTGKTFDTEPAYDPTNGMTPKEAAADNSITTKGDLETYIKNLEEKLNSIGDDAQLANVDLQNMLQKQQQTLQMMSNISKMLHDTAMAIIRKIGG